MKPTALAVLGGLSAQAFLSDYWQRRPLLVRGAYAGVRNPLSPKGLARLACASELPARLVLTQGGRHPWEVRHGPLVEQDFQGLPGSHWTLLVQGVERLVPAVARLRNAFNFLPAWRMDDIMVSYASDAGGVGPHLDSYDVFLVQLHGRRRWRINTTPYAYTECVPGLDLRILRDFECNEDWLLEPGDMLYLPPGVAHWGTAQGPCMTYSIGFRAPSGREVWTGYLEQILATLDDGGRYSDPDLQATAHPGEISTHTLQKLKDLLAALPDDPEALLEWFGRELTLPGPGYPEPGRRPDLARLAERLRSGRSQLVRHPGARLAYVDQDRKTWLFASGERWLLGGPLARQARALANSDDGAPIPAEPWLKPRGGLELLADLIYFKVLQERRAHAERSR